MTSFRRITRTSTALFAAGALALGVAACDDNGDNGDVVDAPAEDDGMDDGMEDDGLEDDGMEDDGLEDDGMDDMDEDAS